MTPALFGWGRVIVPGGDFEGVFFVAVLYVVVPGWIIRLIVRPRCSLRWSDRSASGFCFRNVLVFLPMCVLSISCSSFSSAWGRGSFFFLFFFLVVFVCCAYFGWSWGGAANVIYEVCRHVDVLCAVVRVLCFGRGVRVCFGSLFLCCVLISVVVAP